jgi:C4-dicarboxylate-specific signal transduction histidine kinase
MIVQHKPDLAMFLTTDERGKLIPDFITDLANCLGQEQNDMLNEVQSLSKGIDHIKQIVAAQQSMAKKSNMSTSVQPASLVETALGLQPPGLSRDVQLRKDFADMPQLMLDQHKILQVLINLIANARQAVMVRPAGKREITLTVGIVSSAQREGGGKGGGERLRYQVTDNGMGIAPEHLTRIFSHGFTTKTEGHGFGLHSAANAAKEMGGSLSATSEGVGRGAVFVLDLPVRQVEEAVSCKV